MMFIEIEIYVRKKWATCITILTKKSVHILMVVGSFAKSLNFIDKFRGEFQLNKNEFQLFAFNHILMMLNNPISVN